MNKDKNKDKEYRYSFYMKKFEGFYKDFENQGAIIFLKDNYDEKIKKSLENANRILNNVFLFNRPWDMEPTSVPYKFENIIWNYAPNGDDEWIFMLNRHEYLEDLVIAYYLTYDKKYIYKWIEVINDWINKNTPSSNEMAWRTIEVGIRCLSWTFDLIRILPLDILKEDEFEEILKSLSYQVRFIKDNIKDKDILSNWGVLQTTGVLTVLMAFYERIEDKDLINWAEKTLVKQLEVQVLEDGVHWEQSPMYHVEVLLSTLKMLYIAEVFNFTVNKVIKDKAYDLSNVLIYSTAPDHHQIMQSDSDYTDTRDIMCLSALVLNKGEFKDKSYERIDYSTLWLLGGKYIKIYDELISLNTRELDKAFLDSGNYYLRSDWSEQASFAYFHNGTLGSGHGHADLLHYNISPFGENFIIDPGRYTYVEDDKLRTYFKSPKAHNCIIINEEDFTQCKGSWGYHSVAKSMNNYHKFKNDICYIEGVYMVENPKEYYVVTRKFIYIKPSLWIVCDVVNKKGENYVKRYIHMDRDVKIESKGKGYIMSKNGINLQVISLFLNEVYIKNDYVSRKYNEIHNSKTLVGKSNFKDIGISVDVLYGTLEQENMKVKVKKLYQAGKSEPLTATQGTALEIELPIGEKYVIIIIHQEIYIGKKLIIYNKEVSFYGKVLVLKHTNEGLKHIKLKI